MFVIVELLLKYGWESVDELRINNNDDCKNNVYEEIDHLLQ